MISKEREKKGKKKEREGEEVEKKKKEEERRWYELYNKTDRRFVWNINKVLISMRSIRWSGSEV